MPSKSAPSFGHVAALTVRVWLWCVCTACFIFSNDLAAQRTQYNMVVSLDTAKRTLSGTIDITYTNRTSQPMDRLGVHLYPNAYANNQTAFAKQKVFQGDVSFAHAPSADRGYIRGMKFMSDGVEQPLVIDSQFLDIGWIMLRTPLLPAASISLSSPFTVKVPKSFSRLGRTDESYQFTQWYPQIAVAEDDFWHVMPYLDYGEYYNDFADYKVAITLPEGYNVACTGIGKKVNSGKPNLFVWEVSADNVIDFAWFASPHFTRKSARVASKEKIIEIFVFTDTTVDRHWEKAMEYAKRAVDHYSEWVGAYPYEQISVVSTPFSAAGFMEYPMVAQISYTSDTAFFQTAIAHEIGHTWIYGALANNERLHPWMDEGLNTFVERRYTDKYLPHWNEIALSPEVSHKLSMSQDDAWQHLIRYSGKTQPPASDPQRQSINQYVLSAYTLPSQGFELLMAQVGEDMIRDMINMYYEDHKYQHVSPDDMRSSFESICDCNLGWLFDDWMQHAHAIDYRIGKWNAEAQEVLLENHGPSGIPLQLTTYKDDKPVEVFWLDGFEGNRQLAYNLPADEIRLYDAAPAINKVWWNRVKPRPVLPYFTLFPKVSSYQQASVNVTPFASTNISDGAMPGIVLTSGLLPQPKLKWILAPFYGLESKGIRGYGEVRYAGDITYGPFDKLLLSFSTDYFGYEVDTHYNFRSQYLRLSPKLALRMYSGSSNPLITQWLKYRIVNLHQFYGTGLPPYEDKIYVREQRFYDVHEIAYSIRSDYALRPFLGEANVQTGKGFLRLNLHYKQHFRGRDKQRGLWVQGFAGWLPVYDNPDAIVHFDIHGYASNGIFSTDYMFDQWLGGRNENSGLYARQIYPRDANLKTLVTNGIGDKWMLGAGGSLALPFRWLHVYMDGAYYPNTIEQETILSYSGGIALVLVKDVFEIYLPLMESRDIRESLSYVVRDQWFERVAFQFNYKFINPLDLADRWTLRY